MLDGVELGAAQRAREAVNMLLAQTGARASAGAVPTNYSAAEALIRLAEGSFRKTPSPELDWHRREEERLHAAGRITAAAAGNVLMPFGLLGLRAPYQVGTAAQGGNLVATQTFDPVPAQRPVSVTAALGAQVIAGLQESVTIPVQATVSNTAAVAESGAAGESEATINKVTSTPKTQAAFSVMSRTMLKQTSIEEFVRGELILTGHSIIDNQAINGSGTGNQSTGVLNTAGVTSASGASLTYTTLLGTQSGVLGNSAVTDPNRLGYATTPAVAGALAQRATGTLNWPMWAGSLREGLLAGVRAVSSAQLPAGSLMYGDWSRLLLLFWGDSFEVTVNPYQYFATGDISLRMFVSFDTVVQRPASFSVLTSVS